MVFTRPFERRPSCLFLLLLRGGTSAEFFLNILRANHPEPYLCRCVCAHVEVKYLRVCLPLTGDISFLFFFWSKIRRLMDELIGDCCEILHERMRTKNRGRES